MQSEGDLRLPPVTTEVSFANQESDQDAVFQFGRHCRLSLPAVLRWGVSPYGST